VGPHVGPQPGHVRGSVVEAEHEAPGQPGQIGVGLDAVVEFADPGPHVDPSAAPSGQRGRHDVAHPFVARGGQQPGSGRRVGDRIGIGDPAQLQIAAGGQLDGAVAVLGGRLGQGVQLGSSDHAAGDPQPGQRAVGGLVHLQGARARVVVTRSGHSSTVRPPSPPRESVSVRRHAAAARTVRTLAPAAESATAQGRGSC
jgi:hypothetical protein